MDAPGCPTKSVRHKPVDIVFSGSHDGPFDLSAMIILTAMLFPLAMIPLWPSVSKGGPHIETASFAGEQE
jgi:hypothetical protein